MADAFLQELSGLTGLPYYQQHTVIGEKGSLIGARDGMIVSLGLGKIAGGSKAVSVLIRYPSRGGAESLKTVLKDAGTKFSKIEADDFAAIAHWTYTFGKPKAQEVADELNKLVTAAKVTPGFSGKCELCQSASTPNVMLRNSVPGYYCQSCQDKLRIEGQMADETYARMDTNLPRGVMFGLAAALAGSLAWGLVAYALNYIFFIGAVLIGWVVTKAVEKGTGKVNLAGKVIAFVLTVASVLFGDAIFYTLSIMKAEAMPFSMELLQFVLANFVEIETSDSSGIFSILFAIVGAGAAVYSLKKPKFVDEFTPLDQPAMGKGAGA